METLRERPIFCFTYNEEEIVRQHSAGLPLSAKPGHGISTYEELLEKVSALNFYNPALKLLFRGQKIDYFNYRPDKSPVRSNLYPSIMRALPVNKTQRTQEIGKRVNVLKHADALLKENISIGYIHRHMLVRWAILQHYEVCNTPLLDLTDSLQVALTFALGDTANEGFLYVFGLHHQAGPISVSLESMTQVVDLAKICPPEVSRPHFQSAFLAADYPTAIYTDDLINRAPRVEANFACRLLTKFHLKEVNSWIGRKFSPIHRDILFPNNRDRWYAILADIKKTIAL
jgi:hypothetical protein